LTDPLDHRIAQRDALLLALSDQLRTLAEPLAIIEAAVGILGRHLGAQRVGYGEVQADDETITLETTYVDGLPALRGTFALDAFGAANIVSQRLGLTVADSDVRQSVDALDPVWAAIDTRAFASAPLIREGRLRATLFVNFRHPHPWTPEELSLIEDVAARIWDSLERARAEAALRDSRARLALSEEALRLATEMGEIGTWDLDLISGALTWPPRTRAMFGISPDAPVSMDDFYAGLHFVDRQAVIEAFAAAIDPARRLTYDVEYRTVGKEDGAIRWVAAKGRGLFDEHGRCYRALGTAIDITARKAEQQRMIEQAQALAYARDSLAAIFNASCEGLTLCRLIRDETGEVVDYQVLDANPAHERLTGASRALMLAKPVSKIAPPVNPLWFNSAAQAVAENRLQTFEVRSPVTGRWLDIHVSPVSGDLFAQTFIDVTARHEIEEQRRRFLTEMNHRVKNNFQMVSSVLDLQARRAKSAEARDHLGAAHQRIHILAELHNSLAAAPDAAEVDFALYLGALCEKLRGLIDDPERVRVEVIADSVMVESGVAVALGFVVNELVTNAIKYAFPHPAAGAVTVSFQRDEAGGILRIADNGQGLPAQVETKGSGLGMRLVRSFVSQIGGRLEVEHGPGVAYAIYLAG
jgi:two-component sensor histidine kinase